MARESIKTYRVDIWIAGDAAEAKKTVRRFCMEHGFCATVTETTFIYTGGEESGVRVGCIDYPRFPVGPERLWDQAHALAEQLRTDLFQHSFSLCADDRTEWFSAR